MDGKTYQREGEKTYHPVRLERLLAPLLSEIEFRLAMDNLKQVFNRVGALPSP